jgi:hypothetical protein
MLLECFHDFSNIRVGKLLVTSLLLKRLFWEKEIVDERFMSSMRVFRKN